MRANSGLMSTIVGSLPGNIALKYILSNLDEKHNIYIRGFTEFGIKVA